MQRLSTKPESVMAAHLQVLATEFQVAAIQQHAEAVRAGYQDERYRPMIDEDAVRAARDLVDETRLQGMFARMCGDRRFELTIEWLVVQPRFGQLFDPGLVSQARQRLTQGGFSGQFPT